MIVLPLIVVMFALLLLLVVGCVMVFGSANGDIKTTGHDIIGAVLIVILLLLFHPKF